MTQSPSEYLRLKAAQFRRLASEHQTDIAPKLLEIAEQLEAEANTQAGAAGHADEMPKPPCSSYRIYFRGTTNVILGREDFAADDDKSAMTIAYLLFDACSDECETYELWRGPRRIDLSPRDPQLRSSALQLIAARQEKLIEHEERMRDSQWAIGKSRRLLDQLGRLHAGK